MEHPWEDYLLERKVESDLKDLPKTLVAFANSVRPNHIATILIGEKDDGTIAGVTNPDNIEKRVRKDAEKIYPPIIWRTRVYEKDRKYCVKVEIEYSGNTPHFGGIAWCVEVLRQLKLPKKCFNDSLNFAWMRFGNCLNGQTKRSQFMAIHLLFLQLAKGDSCV